MQLLLVVLVLSPACLFAQEEKQNESKIKVGIGASLISFDPVLYYDWDMFMNHISVPVDFGKFRLEPQIGITLYKYSASSWSSGHEYYIDGSIGLFLVSNKTNFKLHYGLRPGLWHFDDEKYPYLSLSAGGEYFFSKHFSIGAETQLRYMTDSEDWFDYKIITTNTSLLIRYYFN